VATTWRMLRSALLIALPLFVSSRSGIARDSWIEAKSPHFVVISNGDAVRAREVAGALERIRAFFGETLPDLALSPDPVRVFAVEDEASLESLVPEYRELGLAVPAGLFRPGFGGNIVLRLDLGDVRRRSVLYHEYVHLLTRRNLGSLPLWLDEGLAQFWGNTVLRGDEAELGLPSVSTRARLRAERPIPLPDFFAADSDSPLYVENGKKAIFYAQSWALTHYLLLGEGGVHRAMLAAYLDELTRGADPVEAARRSFGDFRELGRRIEEYRAARRFSSVRRPAPPEMDGAQFSVRTLSLAEAAAARADFLARGPSYRDAGPLVRSALASAPGLPLAHEVLSLLRARHQEEALVRGLLPSASHGGRVPGPRASGVVAAPGRDAADSDIRPRIPGPLPTPDSASSSTYVELAYFYAGIDRTLERALAAVRKAAELDPDSPWYQSLVARTLLQSGRREEALATMREAAALSLRGNRASEARDVCFYGSLAGLADAVGPACDAAVAARPADGRFRESRAVARSIAGDVEGAVDDFRAALADESFLLSTDERAQRRLWIRRLEARKNPFDEETRRELLGLPF
jgi:tetratricopeptide (TPR) repeat protein